MRSTLLAIVVAFGFIASSRTTAEAGCGSGCKWSLNRPVFRRLFVRECADEPVACPTVKVDYPTPVRNFLFGVERIAKPICKSCK